MKQAEFLNLETKQVQWLDASLEHPNLVRVPDGADTATFWGDCIIFWKNKYWSWCIKNDSHWRNSKKYPDDFLNLVEYLDINGIDSIIWQRQTPLRQKVDEAKQKLGMNERQLSKAIGREESYITKLFQDKRNPKPKTIETLISDLDKLMNQKPKESSGNEVNVMKISNEQGIGLKIALLNQANQNAEMYRHKCEAQANLIKWMGGLIVMLLAILMMVAL